MKQNLISLHIKVKIQIFKLIKKSKILWKKINHTKIITDTTVDEHQYYKINCTTKIKNQYNTVTHIPIQKVNCNCKPYIITTNTDKSEIGFTTTPKQLMKLIKERFIKIIKKEHKQNNKLHIVKCYKQTYKQIINQFKIKEFLSIKINII